MSENQRDPQYKLRWSEDLRDKVTESAKSNNRSINAEITTRLEESFEPKHDQQFFDKLVDVHQAGFFAGLAESYKSKLKQINEQLKTNPTEELLKEKIHFEIIYNEMNLLKENSFKDLDLDDF